MLFQQKNIFANLVKEISRTIGESVIFTNELGIIIASTQEERIGSFHEGAKLAMLKREYMHMTGSHVERLQGVRKGVVTPIYIDGRPMGVVGITGEPIHIEPFILIVQRLAELFIKNAADQMAQEKYLRNLELFVFDWLNQSITLSELHEYGDFYKLNLPYYEQVMLIQTKNTESISSDDIERMKNVWDVKGNAIFIRWGQGRLLLLDCYRGKEQLQIKLTQFLEVTNQLLGTEVYVGVGQRVNHFQIGDSLRQAEMALELANEMYPIVFEADLVFEYIQHHLDEVSKEVFIRRTIEPLLLEEELLHTLRVWFANRMKVEQTAKSLHIHKNTLYYRLNKITQLTNKDLDRMHDIVLLYMALKFAEV